MELLRDYHILIFVLVGIYQLDHQFEQQLFLEDLQSIHYHHYDLIYFHFHSQNDFNILGTINTWTLDTENSKLVHKMRIGEKKFK